MSFARPRIHFVTLSTSQHQMSPIRKKGDSTVVDLARASLLCKRSWLATPKNHTYPGPVLQSDTARPKRVGYRDSQEPNQPPKHKGLSKSNLFRVQGYLGSTPGPRGKNRNLRVHNPNVYIYIYIYIHTIYMHVCKHVYIYC